MKHILTFAALVFATACFGQVEIQLEFTMLEGYPHTPRSTQIEFLTGDSVLAFEPIGFEGSLLGAGTPAFSSPYPFGFDTNCSDQGWIMNFGAVIEFEVTGYPSHFSIHTSFWDSYPASIIEVAIKSGNFWVPLGSVTYQGTGCGWYQYELPGAVVWGCTDEGACNFNSEANLDDESCEYGCLNCGPGTVWDESVQLCVGANPSDTDFDGCVGMTDLLDLLSVFGTCNEIPWSCGDPLEYQGYDYETVQIGEKCWFAENLRVTSYRNGEGVDSYQDPANWASASNGGMCTYGNSSSNDGVFGLLYNWYAVDDARGLCPNGWSVPTDGEWMTMEMSLGMSEAEANGTWWRGTNQGSQMKSDYGWNIGGNGTNSSGFSGLPGGYRESNGNFSGAGYDGNWWSSSSDGANAWHRFLFWDTEAVNRGVHNHRRGVSVRCIQDSE